MNGPSSLSPTSLGPTSHSYFSQRLRLHYVDWGNPDAPPLLLVHGGRDHCRSWDWVADALRESFHIIAVDLRGHGDSAWAQGSSYAIPDFVYDIEQLVRQEKLAPVNIISHSMGGAISLLYAGTYPETVAKLIAIEGVIWSPSDIQKYESKPPQVRIGNWVEQLHKLAGRLPHRYESIAQATARMQEANPRLSAAQARHLTIHGMHQNEDGTYSWKFDNYIRAQSPIAPTATDIATLMGRITCPTLLIGGDQSFVSDPAKNGALAQFPNAKSVILPDAGHWVHHDKLDEFLALTRSFLGG
jgi:pimeloyl-ACP methyl ester carboxylesterase